MKSKKFLTVFVLLFCMNSFAQKITFELLINGDKTIKELSKSKANHLTIQGTGCEDFEISVSGMKMKVLPNKKGYILSPLKDLTEGSIRVVGVQKGIKIALGTHRYQFKE